MAARNRYRHHRYSSNMALSSGRLVTSIISPCAGKGAPDLLKDKSSLHKPGVHVYLATGLDFREKILCLFWIGSIGTRLWLQPPTLPLYYEGKTMKTIFPQNYVYVLLVRTTTTRHMVSFIDFYFHFLANLQN